MRRSPPGNRTWERTFTPRDSNHQRTVVSVPDSASARTLLKARRASCGIDATIRSTAVRLSTPLCSADS